MLLLIVLIDGIVVTSTSAAPTSTSTAATPVATNESSVSYGRASMISFNNNNYIKTNWNITILLQFIFACYILMTHYSGCPILFYDFASRIINFIITVERQRIGNYVYHNHSCRSCTHRGGYNSGYCIAVRLHIDQEQ